MKMEEQTVLGDPEEELKLEDDEEEFRSCCEDEDELKEREVSGKDDELDEFSVKMLFKGVSVIAQVGECGSGICGIGVVMERSPNLPLIQVQKRLDFYVDECVADYLALMGGLLEALRNKVRRVFAFTDSKALYDQIMHGTLENLLLVALRQRILQHANELDTFVLKFVPSFDLKKPLHLACVAIGIVSFQSKEDESFESCSICCEKKPPRVMITFKCSHKFCSDCMKTYINGKVLSSHVLMRCPMSRCKYLITATECRSFLPVNSYEALERALAEANVLNSAKLYCPFSDCSVLLGPRECLSSRACSSSQSDSSRVECPVCKRDICIECGVPWHSSLICEEYQNLPLEERDAGDITLHRLAQNKRWMRCQQCKGKIELIHGRYHMLCWCGQEFCYSCGAEYRDGQQTCLCSFWEEKNSDNLLSEPTQDSDPWSLNPFDSFPINTDSYSDQERSQVALMQRFIAGGFSLSDHHTCQSPPHFTYSSVDPMKDLHQLPWLERFVSAISYNY